MMKLHLIILNIFLLDASPFFSTQIFFENRFKITLNIMIEHLIPPASTTSFSPIVVLMVQFYDLIYVHFINIIIAALIVGFVYTTSVIDNVAVNTLEEVPELIHDHNLCKNRILLIVLGI